MVNHQGILWIYDNTKVPVPKLGSIIGNRPFSSIIFKGQNLKTRFINELKSNGVLQNIVEINALDDIYEIISMLEGIPQDTVVMHFYSNCIVKDSEGFSTLLNKAKFIKREIMVMHDHSVSCLMFNNIPSYINFLKLSLSVESTMPQLDRIDYLEMESNSLQDISEFNNFIQFISGGFDARYFNSLQGDENIVVKTSAMKNKIKSEYQYYHLLPDHMKKWYVLPYNYNETEFTASYTMERYNMSDMAVKWIHGSIDYSEFDRFLKKVFSFVNSRDRKSISPEEYIKKSDDLYLTKLTLRIKELKAHELYHNFERFISAGTHYKTIDEVVTQYTLLYKNIMKDRKFNSIAVIGHGDLCFSNMLYDSEMALLRLIDPKGANTEEELWTDPYYDIAKLSHSICGMYDFFNSGLYHIRLGADFKFHLNIDHDNLGYIEILKKYLHQYEYDYTCVRLFEASLFLSMLPLHMDHPTKVFGFLLNAIKIMNEVEQYV